MAITTADLNANIAEGVDITSISYGFHFEIDITTELSAFLD